MANVARCGNGLELSSGGKLRNESHPLRVVNCHTTPHFLSPDDGGPEAPCHVRQTHDAGKENALGLKQVFAAVEGGCAHGVKYQVVGFGILGEIFSGVIDHVVGTQGFH